MKKRIVITGLGVESSLGDEIEDFWSALIRGVSGISEISSFDTSAVRNHYGGEIKNFNDHSILKEAERKVYGRATQFAIVAAKKAIDDAKFENLPNLNTKIGVIIGTTFGEAQIVEQATRHLIEGYKDGKSSLYYLKQYNPDSVSVNVARKFGFCGPNLVIPTACAAGNYAIAYGAELIAMGRAQVVIAGGSDPFSHVSFSGFSRLGVMANEKCQPFDKNRKGMLVGEGAGIVVLEEHDTAKARGANVYCELLGYGLSCDASHMTIPEVIGITAVMEKAIRSSGISYRDVNYICAHGTGTAINDKTESQAIRKIFYKKGHIVPVSSIKSMLGHTMGAASAIETIASTLAIYRSEIPPTVNFETKDPECDIDCVPNESRRQKVNVVLNNAFAFGGNNACLVLGRC